MAALRVFDDFREVFFGVEMRTVKLAFRIAPHRAHFREFRPALEVDAPALVFSQMPVQYVQLMVRHRVDHLLDRLLAEEVTPLVDKASAPFETRRIGDRAAGVVGCAVGRSFRMLRKRHPGIEFAACVMRRDFDAVRRHCEAISFRRDFRVSYSPEWRVCTAITGSCGEFTRCRNQCCRKESCYDRIQHHFPPIRTAASNGPRGNAASL